MGVAMFAQWSILSNITSGIILFFSFPFKIGDLILIHDKDFPIEADRKSTRLNSPNNNYSECRQNIDEQMNVFDD